MLSAVNSHHRGHEDDFQMVLIGIGIIISSFVIILILTRVELHFEKHNEKYSRFRKRFVWSVLLIIAGAFCLICVLIDTMENTSKNADGIIASTGFVYLLIGVLMFRSIFQ